MTIIPVLYDSADPFTLPPWDGVSAYAGYVDGFADYLAIRAEYPGAQVMSITGHGGIAECADIEQYLMADADGPGWHRRAVARGVERPVLYRQASSTAGLITLMSGAGIPRTAYRLWSAHYGAGKHICGPGVCGYPQADATQWTCLALGRNLDQSALTPGFFGATVLTPPPAEWVFGRVRNLTLLGAGPSSVKLSWYSPGKPMPLGVGAYEVALSEGTVLNRVYRTYPREVPKTAASEVTWQGGQLQPATKYTAGVRALAPDGHHASQWALITFVTSPRR